MNYVGGQIAEVGGHWPGRRRQSPIVNLYFLWSVERVGMIYSVPAMGGVDWYQVGAAAILRAQQAGRLVGGEPRSVDPGNHVATLTPASPCCSRSGANVAHDLTANLRGKPNQSTMRSGGETSEVPNRLPDPAGRLISEAERLARELPTATPARQDAILTELRDGKGVGISPRPWPTPSRN